MDRCEAGEGAKVEEVCERLFERHDEGLRVRCRDTHSFFKRARRLLPEQLGVRGCRWDFAFLCARGVLCEKPGARSKKLSGTLDREKHLRVVSRGIRQNRPAPRVGKVVARDRISIRPFRVGSQMKCPDATIGRNFPTLRNARDNCAVRCAQIDKRLVDHACTAQLVLVAHALRVERVAVGTLDDDEVGRRQRPIERHGGSECEDEQEDGRDEPHRRRIRASRASGPSEADSIAGKFVRSRALARDISLSRATINFCKAPRKPQPTSA